MIGLLVTIVPSVWLGLFSRDPAVLAIGTLYLRRVGPVYGAVGLATLLYFAAQGIGRVVGPVLAATVRLLIAAGLGWVAVTHFRADLSTLFSIVAAAAVVFTTITAIAVGLQLRPRAPVVGDVATDPASLSVVIADQAEAPCPAQSTKD